MKIFLFILLLLSCNKSNNHIDCEDIKSPENKRDCIGKLSISEIKKNYKYCCYIEFDVHKFCIPFNQEDYDEIKPKIIDLINNKYIIKC